MQAYVKRILKNFNGGGAYINQTLTVMRMTNVILIRNLYQLCLNHFSNKEEVRQEPEWKEHTDIIRECVLRMIHLEKYVLKQAKLHVSMDEDELKK